MEQTSYAVILDMDGVVIDSNPFHRVAWTRFLSRKGVTATDEMFRTLIFGTTGDEAIQELLGGTLTQDEIDRYSYEIDEEYRTIIKQSDGIKPVGGLVELLKAVKQSGYQLALATSAPTENVSLVLNKLGLYSYFDLIVDKTQVVNGKPDPEIYRTATARLAIEKERCIVFEDSISGIHSARGAGLTVVGVTTSHSPSELKEAGAAHTIADFTAITVQDIARLIEKAAAQ